MTELMSSSTELMGCSAEFDEQFYWMMSSSTELMNCSIDKKKRPPRWFETARPFQIDISKLMIRPLVLAAHVKVIEIECHRRRHDITDTAPNGPEPERVP